jgi:hypothetical protein
MARPLASALLGLLLCLSLSAPKAQQNGEPAGANGGDAAQLMIDGGRLGAMLDQAEAASELSSPTRPVDPVETPGQQAAYVTRGLRSAVLRYNALQLAVCRAGAAELSLCTQPYLPEWMNEPLTTQPASVILRSRVREVQDHIAPLWSALCGRAKLAAHDEHFCDLE